jgi:chitinase
LIPIIMRKVYKSLLTSGIVLILTSCYTFAAPPEFRVVGYFASWNDVQPMARTLDYSQLTHINYAFTNVTDTLGSLIEMGADLDTLVAHAHAAGVKVLISMGGGAMDETTISNYYYLISTTQHRAHFIHSIYNYLQKYHLDGFDVDIEGPRINGNYGAFITQLVDSLRPKGKLVTAALGDWGGDAVPVQVVPLFDYINIMSYDAAGNWDQSNVAQHSPYELALNGINKWASRGALRENLVVGLPFYGYAFNDLKSLGFMYYKDILQRYPYAYNQDTVGSIILYNGINTIQRKTCLALDSAGGVMIWELGYDATGEHSLMKAITDSRITYMSADKAPVVTFISPQSDTTITTNTITIKTSVTDPDGVFRKSSIYVNDVFISESFDSLNQFTLKNLGAGTYSVIVEDIDHQFRAGRAPILVYVNTAEERTPFNNEIVQLPGKIEAENYDIGGQDISYHDATAANEGKAYRADGVDIEACYDAGAGFDVGYTGTGEWLEYSVEVTDSGYYDIDFRTSSVSSGRTISVRMDGADIVTNKVLNNSGGWQVWVTTTAKNIHLTAGQHVFRLNMNSGGFNLNYLLVKPSVISSTVMIRNNQISCFPDPASNNLYVRAINSLNGEIRLINTLGQIVLNGNYYDNSGAYTEIDISSFAAGIYRIQINSGDTLYQGSFIKK